MTDTESESARGGRLRAAVAGAGWGGVHARGFAESEHCDLCAIWSRSDKAENRALADSFGVELFTDYQKMLSATDPDIVSVAVPEAVHGELTLAALEHGCHVYCEKVLSDCRATAERMVERARQGGLRLNVGYCYRYSPSCLYLTEAVRSGKLGRLLFAHLRAFTWCLHHMTDYATSLLGAPRRVSAVLDMEPLAGKPHISSAALAFPTFTYAAFTKKVYMVEYEAGGVLMAGGTDYTSIEQPGATLLVQGSDGRAELDDLTGKVTVWRGGREAMVFTPSQICDAIGLRENCVAAVKDFARAVSEGEPAPVPGEDGVAMICLEEAILRSSRSRAWEMV